MVKAQIQCPPLLHEQLKEVALEAWDRITPQGEPKGSYTKILQGPNEAYADFLTRLGVGISHNVVREETRVQLEKLFAYENVNQEFQRAIAPIREIWNVNDYLKDCHNLGSQTQTMQMLAEAMAAAFRGMKDVLFVEIRAIEKTIALKNTQKKNNTTKKPPGVCPQCKKGVRWAKKYRSKCDI